MKIISCLIITFFIIFIAQSQSVKNKSKNNVSFSKRNKIIKKGEKRDDGILLDFHDFDTVQQGSKQIKALRLHPKWIQIHKYHHNFILYKPCDLCYHTMIFLSDSTIQFKNCEISTSQIVEATQTGKDKYRILYNNNISDLDTLFLERINRKREIFSFSLMIKGMKTTYYMTIPEMHNQFDFIMNLCLDKKEKEMKN